MNNDKMTDSNRLTNMVGRLRAYAIVCKQADFNEAADAIEELMAALLPFGNAALDLDPGDHGSIWEHHAAMDIDCDDLRNCQRLLYGSRAVHTGEKE